MGSNKNRISRKLLHFRVIYDRGIVDPDKLVGGQGFDKFPQSAVVVNHFVVGQINLQDIISVLDMDDVAEFDFDRSFVVAHKHTLFSNRFLWQHVCQGLISYLLFSTFIRKVIQAFQQFVDFSAEKFESEMLEEEEIEKSSV